MKIKQTILAFALLVGIGGFSVAPEVSAATCGGVTTSIISCTQAGGDKAELKDTGVWGILTLAIKILTAGVGVVGVGGVIYGSILYASAGGSAEQSKQAKVVIFNVVIGLVAYALMFSFLNFIIPGGLFS
jgi:hypothetical protein